ncbi:hypothetical protein L2E82_42286 [Cichorium intybus]|uniref:Uncharacterized protein n=1 Tax=Cichorium intybus TaxID=13427 RepID=A0ACB8ZM95_CICIN|nr:hypothetical protein L2E82_42286 [Cichorium intybus]
MASNQKNIVAGIHDEAVASSIAHDNQILELETDIGGHELNKEIADNSIDMDSDSTLIMESKNLLNIAFVDYVNDMVLEPTLNRYMESDAIITNGDHDLVIDSSSKSIRPVP